MNIGDKVYYFVSMEEVNEKPGFKVGVATITNVSQNFFYELKCDDLTEGGYDDPDEIIEVLFSISKNDLATTKEELHAIVEKHLDTIKMYLNDDVESLDNL